MIQSAGVIEVDVSLYRLIAVTLAMVGILLARLVTIDAENKRLGRRQSWRETGPLTWVAVLIVCPFIWHYEVAVPWAALIGLGIGYSVRVILRILGDASVNAARAVAEKTIESIRSRPFGELGSRTPPTDIPPDMQELLDRMDQKDAE